ncbi:Sepiapterin reductase [Phytophthora citrophthora]|uniref:Sepiapterin reductase n=1 Tax=Phytophthora citrophthora TaxID=4793 RepID=A0AAD9LMU5_9STRA|nr:Sepiapterin reductase [Phytophthora citrophthora]
MGMRVETHAHCRKLLASVAIGNHLRFRFMLWQQFTIYRKRLANLLLMAANPPVIATQTRQENVNDVQSVHDEPKELAPETNFDRPRQDLVSLGHALAQKARILQRFEVSWDLPQTWHRWRQIFHAKLFYRMRRLHLFFVSWQQCAHRQRRNRFIVLKLTRQRVAISAQTIFRAWADLVARVKQLHKDRIREREVWVLVNTEMVRRERKQLKKHWHAWKFHVEEARHLQKSLDAYHRARLLTKFWLLWCHDFRQVIRAELSEFRHRQAQMQRFYLRRALKSLKIHQQRAKRARLVFEYFSNRHSDALIPEVFARWRKWSHRRKEIAHNLEVARLNQTRRQFTFWKIWKNAQRWQRIAVDRFQLKNNTQKRREIWIRWRRYVKNRVAKALAMEKAAICHVRNRLRKRWLYHTQLAMKLQEQIQTANDQLCVFRCNRAVNRWRNFSHAQHLRRLYQRFVLRKHVQLWQSAVKNEMAVRFNEFLARSKAKKLLVAWHQVAVKQQQWRLFCMCFEERKTIRTARKSFLKWQQFINSRQGKRLAGMHAKQRLLRKVWRCWDRFTLASQLRRHEQLERAAEYEAFALLRRSLRVWQAVAKRQRERRFVLLSCVIKLQSVAGQRVQEVIFQSWKQVVNHRRRCRVELFNRERKIAKRLLFYWLMWTRSKQRNRQQLENAAVYHSQRLKSTVFFYWQAYAFAWQDVVKPVSNQQMVLLTGVAALPRNTKDNEDSDDDVRRPISPVVKRLREKKSNRSRAAVNTDESSDTVPLSDAVEISMDVKKRLILLGKWKSQPKDKSKANLFSLPDRIAMRSAVVVTGASRGFGRCLALNFARELASSYLDLFLWARDENGLKMTLKLAQEARQSMQQAEELRGFIQIVDLGDSVDYSNKVNALLAQLSKEHYDTVFLVHNAGALGALGFAQECPSPEEMTRHFELNVVSVMWLNKRLLDVFGASRGQVTKSTMSQVSDGVTKLVIVNISSRSAIAPYPTLSQYCTAKAAREMHSLQVLLHSLTLIVIAKTPKM